MSNGTKQSSLIRHFYEEVWAREMWMWQKSLPIVQQLDAPILRREPSSA